MRQNSWVRTSVRRIGFTIWLFIASVIGTGCPNGDQDQQKAIAKNVDRLAVLIKDGREIRDELEEYGIIGRDEARKITAGLTKVNSALRAFKNRAQTYRDAGGLTPEGKDLLRKLAKDIAGAAVELINDGTFGVKNPDAQTRIKVAIGAIEQVTLVIVDAVALLKTKPAPVQKAGFDPVSAIPILLLALRQAYELLARQRGWEGKTTEEIYADAGAQIDANTLALAADQARYAPEGEITAETQAQIDALFEQLTQFQPAE